MATGKRAPSARRQVADELAALLTDGDGLREVRLLHLLRLVEEPTSRAPIEEKRDDHPAGPEPIGIWHPVAGADGERLLFERRAPDASTDLLWDTRPTIAATKAANARRVCLIGESAAAGWFYAPHVTPAMVLEDSLRRLGAGAEVVNLAKVDLQQDELAGLVRASLQLDPDAIVLYVGNNWGTHFRTADAAQMTNYQTAARAYRAEGPAGLMRVTNQAVANDAASTMADVARAAAGVPVVVVIPEVNLADWDRSRPVPWLPRDATALWHAALAAGMDNAERGDWNAVAARAREMIALDGGCCPTSHRLLANALGELAERAGALAAARAEVDARSWDNHPHTPGATTTIQQALRAATKRHGFGCVDLPAVVANAGDDVARAGRDLMLDYCHLSLGGMAVSMDAVAIEVASLVRGEPSVETSARDSSAAGPRPTADPSVDARAKLLSALYGAHWSADRLGAASRPNVSHWIQRALSAWAPIKGEMQGYVATRSAAPDLLPYSVAQQRMRDGPAAGRLDARVLRGRTLDAGAVAEIRAAIGEPDDASTGALGAALQPGGTLDLLDPAHHWNVLDRFESSGAFGHARRAFYRAVWPTSSFAVPCTHAIPIVFTVTARLSALDPRSDREAVITLNGSEAGRISLGARWRTTDITIPASLADAGINKLTVHWPSLSDDRALGDLAMREATRRLEAGQPAELHPTFGELFRLDATA